MSFRFLNWFEGSGGGASSELPQESGYVAPVKNTFIHFGEVDQQPDYRPARSGPAKVETSQTEHRSGLLPRLQEEGQSEGSLGLAEQVVEEGPGTPAAASTVSQSFEALTPVEAPIKNTFIHFDEHYEQQPDYNSTVSGPAVLRSAPLERQASGPAGLPLRMGPCGKLDELPSVGSAGHVTGTCKPCAHNWKDAGCSKGASCTFCHICEAEDFHRRRKEKTQRLKAERSRKKGDKEEKIEAPKPVGLLEAGALDAAVGAAIAPGELQLSYEGQSAVIRWCVDLRRLCSQYRYGLSRRFVLRFTDEVPFVLFLNPATSASAFTPSDLRATMQVKCTEPCKDMPRLRLLFALEGQNASAVEDHDFLVEPLCAAQGSWHLGDALAILRVEVSLMS